MSRVDDITRQIQRKIINGTLNNESGRSMTVRGVAKHYGVSTSTAQKALRQLKSDGFLMGNSTNAPLIAPSSKWKVGGNTLTGASPRRLGLVVTDITNPFFSGLCRCVQKIGAGMGYQVLVAGTDGDFEREKRVVKSFLDIGVQGLLVCPGFDDACRDYYSELAENKTWLVFVSRRIEGIDVDSVIVHSFVGGAAMAGHFLTMGYESFGYIAFGHRLKRDERLIGFQTALSEEGVDPAALQIADANGRGIADGYRAMESLMKEGPAPRAVFAYNDLLAIGALQYCQEHGMSVPTNVAIAGFDNLPESRVTNPQITTVSYPVEMIAKLAVENLVDLIGRSSPRRPNRVLLEPHLIVRQSSDPSKLRHRHTNEKKEDKQLNN